MQSIVADTTPLNYLVLIQAARDSFKPIWNSFDPSRCEGRAGSCQHARYCARVDFTASPVVGSSEPEAARRFGTGTSRRRRARSYITMFERLRATTFRSPVRFMVMSMLEQDAERKKRQEGRQ